MESFSSDVMLKIKSAIKAKLMELNAYDDALPEYILVMIANKRSKVQMTEDLILFLSENSQLFTDWLFEVLDKLKHVAEQKAAAAAAAKKSLEAKKSKKEPQKSNCSHADVTEVQEVSDEINNSATFSQNSEHEPTDESEIEDIAEKSDATPVITKVPDRNDVEEVLTIKAEHDADDLLAAELMEEESLPKFTCKDGSTPQLKSAVVNLRCVQVGSAKATAKICHELNNKPQCVTGKSSSDIRQESFQRMLEIKDIPAKEETITSMNKPNKMSDIQAAVNHEDAPSNKRPRLGSHSKTQRENSKVHSELNTEVDSEWTSAMEDEFDVFGKSVALQLRQLPLPDALRLQSEFQNMLTRARINVFQCQKREKQSLVCTRSPDKLDFNE